MDAEVLRICCPLGWLVGLVAATKLEVSRRKQLLLRDRREIETGFLVSIKGLGKFDRARDQGVQVLTERRRGNRSSVANWSNGKPRLDGGGTGAGGVRRGLGSDWSADVGGEGSSVRLN